MRYLRTEILRSSHLRPFIVLTIAKRVRGLGLGLGLGLGWGPGCLKIDDNRGRFTPGLFIVLTITKRAHYKAKSEARLGLGLGIG